MSRLKLFIAGTIVGLYPLGFVSLAAAQVSPPPLVLSPDVADPWLKQLRPNRPRPEAPARHHHAERPYAAAPRPGAPRADEPDAPNFLGRMLAPRPYQPMNDDEPDDDIATAPQPAQPETIRRAKAQTVSTGSRTGSSAGTARKTREIAPQFLPTVVKYSGPHKPGTIVIDTENRYLYLVQDDGTARRYGVGVGRPGFEWAGEHHITRKAEWPTWTPPAEMRERQPNLPTQMAGGPNNPLGARALYLGSTLYRIHGSNEPWTIGHAVSSGCIRMRNQDVIDLYGRVSVGTEVFVI